MLKTYITATNFFSEKLRKEEGEVASWLVLSAGLAAAAFLAKDTVGGIIGDLATAVGTEANN